MIAPGRNNLNLAMRLITPQVVTLHRFAGRTLNAAGVYVPSFQSPQVLRGGSLQPVPARMYESLGLDRTRRYVQWWVQTSILGPDRLRSPDEFVWNGRRYQVHDDTDWHGQDGWCVVTAAQLKEPAANG